MSDPFSRFREALTRDFGPLATRFGLSQLTSACCMFGRSRRSIRRRPAHGWLRRLPALKLLRAKAHRQRNFATFGTRSGATPLDQRPTLQELFASAREAEYPADARMFSVHQAVWDHGYSVADTAQFIRVAAGVSNAN